MLRDDTFGHLLQSPGGITLKDKKSVPSKATKAKKSSQTSPPVQHEAPKAPLRARYTVVPRTITQSEYFDSIDENDITFGLGPAGTGKSFLAVAKAVEYIVNHTVEKIILVRPAVEAGEKLGFLPGTLQEKVDPYLAPLYDALYELLSAAHVENLIKTKVIEVASIGFMRGRTLKNAFVIMDEAQNTTDVQMKMILTRLGKGSKLVVTGDLSQVDLPKHIPSGLIRAERILSNIEGIGFSYFEQQDVVRHQLVQKIVVAYEED